MGFWMNSVQIASANGTWISRMVMLRFWPKVHVFAINFLDFLEGVVFAATRGWVWVGL